MGPYSSRLATAEGPAQGGPLRGPKESREQPLDVGNTGPQHTPLGLCLAMDVF